MAILTYEKDSKKFFCPECGTSYYEDEIQRAFDFSYVASENFIPIYCMDCGVQFTECDVSEYEDE